MFSDVVIEYVEHEISAIVDATSNVTSLRV